MAAKKKLQVFVSSTFIDLRDERQAAVEAILTAGHIPAGMELFTAGDQSQMNVIKRWIDESDVYLLILGFRYGSIEAESKKSYTHLEYEYAVEKGKALFAVVVDERCKKERVKSHPLGLDITEQDNPKELKVFRALVETKMVRHWSDIKDIKLAVMESISEFSRREDLIGWVPGNEAIDGGMLAEEMARLTKENAMLREQVESKSTYAGLTYQEMISLLSQTRISLDEISEKGDEEFELSLLSLAGQIPYEISGTEINLLHGFVYLYNKVKAEGGKLPYSKPLDYLTRELQHVGLAEIVTEVRDRGEHFPLTRLSSTLRYNEITTYKISDDGIKFMLKLKTNVLDA